MENFFYQELNKNTIEAVKQGKAFFMNPRDSHIPPINNSYAGTPITGANYFNLNLANDVRGTRHTEYVKVNEALSSNIEWLSTLPRENRPRGTLYQEEGLSRNAGYSFVLPAAELNQTLYYDNRTAAPQNHYVPFQSNNAKMDNFREFVHEQFANAINASLTNCPFRNNISEREMDKFKTKLVNEITKNPSFMAVMANRASEEVMNFHYIPLDRKNFIEKARNENSPEFMRLNSVITDHVHDMYYNKKSSFNPEFNELSRPLVIKIENLYLGNPRSKPAVDGEISSFVKRMIRQDRPAKVLADTYAGTFAEKAIKLAKTGKRIFAGVMLVGAVIGSQYAFPVGAGIAGAVIAGSLEQIMNFCKTVTRKMGGGDMTHSRLDDLVKVAGHIMAAQELKGNRSLKTCREQNNPQSFYVNLNRLIRDNPQALDQAIAQVNNSRHHRTQSAERGQTMRR
jgi:hypothetical protein